MKIKNKLTQRELELLENIDIKIEDIEYSWEDIEEIKSNIILNGEISNLKGENYETTSIATEYANLADKFLEFEDEA